MASWTLYLIVYLCGVATPVMIVRNLTKHNEDGSSCLLAGILWGLVCLMILVVWVGMAK
jgi:predicted permease